MKNMEKLTHIRQAMLDVINQALDAGKQVSFSCSAMDSYYEIIVNASNEVYLGGYASESYNFGTRLEELSFVDLAHLAEDASSKLG